MYYPACVIVHIIIKDLLLLIENVAHEMSVLVFLSLLCLIPYNCKLKKFVQVAANLSMDTGGEIRIQDTGYITIRNIQSFNKSHFEN